MTWGFVASFGGLVLVMALLLIAESFLVSSDVDQLEDQNGSTELAAALTRAEAATKQAEREIATARSIAIRG